MFDAQEFLDSYNGRVDVLTKAVLCGMVNNVALDRYAYIELAEALASALATTAQRSPSLLPSRLRNVFLWVMRPEVPTEAAVTCGMWAARYISYLDADDRPHVLIAARDWHARFRPSLPEGAFDVQVLE